MNPQTQTPEFRRWFAGSVITNPDGSPMVVYHFTRAAGFGAFKRSPKDIGFHFGTREQAQDRFRSIWEQRTDPRIPIETGEWKLGTLAVYLRITKPLRLPDLGIWGADNLRFELESLFPAKIKEIRFIRTTAQARDFITAMGYDGIVYRNTGEVAGSAEYARRVREARLAMPEDLQRLSAFSPEDQKHPAYQKWSKAMEEYRAFREANAQDSWIAFDPRQVKSATGNRGTFDPKDPDIRNPRRRSETFYVYTPADGNATRDPHQPYDLKRAKEVARNESMRLRDAGFPLEETVAYVNADTPKAETVWSCDAETCELRNPLDERSAKTQIATTVRTYRKAAPHLLGHVLDYGAGLGLGSDTLRESGLSVSSYEPFPARWQGRKPPTYTWSTDIPPGAFQSVVSFSVLNVVDRKERDQVVLEIARALASGGIALVTARLRSDVESATRKRAGGEPGGWWISEKGEERYQKGFTQAELEQYLRRVLGSGFTVERFPVLNGASVRITKSPEMKQNPAGDSRNLRWLVRQVSEPEDRVLDYAASKVGDLYHLYDLVHAGNVLARVQDEAHLHRIMTEVEGLLDDEGVFLFDYEPGPVGTPELLKIAAQHFQEVGRVKFPGLQGTLYAARGPLNPEEARINAEKERRK